MKKPDLSSEAASPNVSPDPDMLDEYDFRGGRRSVYAARYAQGTNFVALAPDVAAVFPDSDAVNEALRALVRAARRRQRKSRETRTMP